MTNKAGKPWNKVRKQVYIKRDILFQHHKNKYIRGLIDRETYIRSLSYMFDVTVIFFSTKIFSFSIGFIIFVLMKKTSLESEVLYREKAAAGLNDNQLLISNQNLLFSALNGLNLESIKILINSNIGLIQSFVQKCPVAITYNIMFC